MASLRLYLEERHWAVSLCHGLSLSLQPWRHRGRSSSGEVGKMDLLSVSTSTESLPMMRMSFSLFLCHCLDGWVFPRSSPFFFSSELRLYFESPDMKMWVSPWLGSGCHKPLRRQMSWNSCSAQLRTSQLVYTRRLGVMMQFLTLPLASPSSL